MKTQTRYEVRAEVIRRNPAVRQANRRVWMVLESYRSKQKAERRVDWWARAMETNRVAVFRVSEKQLTRAKRMRAKQSRGEEQLARFAAAAAI